MMFPYLDFVLRSGPKSGAFFGLRFRRLAPAVLLPFGRELLQASRLAFFPCAALRYP